MSQFSPVNHKNIALVTIKEKPETAIQQHLDIITGNIYHLYNKTEKHFPTHAKAYNSKKPEITITDLEQYLVENNIDIVLAEYGVTGAEIFKHLKTLNIPLIVYFHGYDAYKKELLDKYTNLYIPMFYYAEKIIVVSEDMRKQLANLGAPLEKLANMPCPPKTDFFEIASNYNSNIFLFIGRFVEKKAPQLTIMAFKLVHTVYPESQLLMVGKGPLLDNCKKLVQALGLERAVRFTQDVEHDQLKTYIANAFCYVQHSIVAGDGNSEGTPLSILEAQAAGLPAVSTYHMGIKETILHEQTGYLVKEHDIETMAEYMLKLYADRGLAKTFGQKAKQYIYTRYSLKEHTFLINNIIKNSCYAKETQHKLNDLVTIVIRSVSERTEDICYSLVKKQIAEENIHIIHQTPSTEAIRKRFEIAIQQKRKWTLGIDADILIKPGLINEIITLAEQAPADTFELEGWAIDKYLESPRELGPQLFRTALLPEAMQFIPKPNEAIRPDTHIINQMTKLGYKQVRLDTIIGLHDFEQSYKDIYRKSFIYAKKFYHQASQVLQHWQELAQTDDDFKVAIVGFLEGLNYKAEVGIDSNAEYLHDFERVSQLLKLKEKPALEHSFFENNHELTLFINSVLLKTYTEKNKKIFTAELYNQWVKQYTAYTRQTVKNATNRKYSIVFFSHSASIGGAEKSLLELLLELSSMNISCLVILPLDGTLNKELIRAGIPTYIPSSPYYCWWSSKEEFDQEIFTKHMLESQQTLYNEIIPFVARISPDYIYTQTIGLPWGVMCSRTLGIPHLLGAREYGIQDHDLHFEFGYENCIKILYLGSKYIFCATQDIRNNVFSSWQKDQDFQNKCLIIGNSVHIPEKYKNTPFPLLANKKTFRVLLPGRISKTKGQLEAVRAIAQLRKDNYNVELVLIGNPAGNTYIQAIWEEIATQKIEKHVIIKPFTDNIYEEMLNSDIVISCARKEALGRTLFEACLLNRPIIYTNSGGSPEVFTDNKHGLAYTAGDHLELAKKIQATIDLPLETNQRITEAKKHILENFNKTNYSEKLLNVLYYVDNGNTADQSDHSCI